MASAPIPKNEAARLALLRNYRILDTSPEEGFDRITRLASRIMGMPISLVSLVDEDRQWFKSRVGIDATETPRTQAFCAHAIHEPDIFEIPDARDDARFADNPLVAGPPHIRFYAGAPLITPEGALGTLCVIDREPRQLTDEQRATLKELAAVAMDALDLRIAVAQSSEARQELERSNRELDQFAYMTSHDLQAPLRTVSNVADLFHGKYQPLLDDVGKKSLSLMQDGVARMGLTIRELLRYSRLGNDGEFASIDCQEIVAVVLQDLSATIEEAGAKIKVGSLPVVRGRETEIRLLFQNLLGNALKFRKPDQAPQIEISSARTNGDLVISVSDNGIGIEPGKATEIFGLFHRLHADDSYQGTGVGLAHCRRIVTTHSGKIWVESSPGKGSTFFFTLGTSPDES